MNYLEYMNKYPSNGVYDGIPASAALSCAAMSARNRESLRLTSPRYVPDSDIRPSESVPRQSVP